MRLQLAARLFRPESLIDRRRSFDSLPFPGAGLCKHRLPVRNAPIEAFADENVDLDFGINRLSAFSSIFINEYRTFGPFSPIHLLIFVTPGGLFNGVTAIRKKQVEAHKGSTMSVFFMALVLTATSLCGSVELCT